MLKAKNERQCVEFYLVIFPTRFDEMAKTPILTSKREKRTWQHHIWCLAGVAFFRKKNFS